MGSRLYSTQARLKFHAMQAQSECDESRKGRLTDGERLRHWNVARADLVLEHHGNPPGYCLRNQVRSLDGERANCLGVSGTALGDLALECLAYNRMHKAAEIATKERYLTHDGRGDEQVFF